MRKVKVHIEGIAPYSQSRMHDEPKLDKETADAYEERNVDFTVEHYSEAIEFWIRYDGGPADLWEQVRIEQVPRADGFDGSPGWRASPCKSSWPSTYKAPGKSTG